MLKVDDSKRCISHSSILALLAGLHSNDSATGRTGTTIRGGQEHESIEFAFGVKPHDWAPVSAIPVIAVCANVGQLRLKA